MPPKTRSNVGKDTATSDVEVAPTTVGQGQEGVVSHLVEQLERNINLIETCSPGNQAPAGPVAGASGDKSTE